MRQTKILLVATLVCAAIWAFALTRPRPAVEEADEPRELIADFTVEYFESHERRKDPVFQRDFGRWRQLADAVTSRNEVELMEGLAHPYWEKEKLARQLSVGGTEKIAWDHFHAEATKAKPGDAQRLWDLLGASSAGLTYVPKFGTKACGGFHADWAVIWPTRGARMVVLICFGCSEIAVYRGDDPTTLLYADLQRKALKEHWPLLKAYRRDPTEKKWADRYHEGNEEDD